MSTTHRHSFRKIYMGALALLLSVVPLTLATQAQAQESLFLTCTGGAGSYNFHQPHDPGNPGLDLVLKQTNVTGGDSLYNTCLPPAPGLPLKKALVLSMSADGLLSCTASSNFSGRIRLAVLREDNELEEIIQGTVDSFAISSASKVISVRGAITDESNSAVGAYAIEYLSTADTTECADADGAAVIQGYSANMTILRL
jgi:hypothetical protein